MLKRYKEVTQEIGDLNIPLKNRIISFCLSVLLALVIISGPFAVCINLMIFRDYQKLLAFAIATLLILFVFIIHYVYLKSITNKQVSHLKVVILSNMLFITLFIYMILIIIYFLGVI